MIETRRIPGSFEPPAMSEVADFALSKDDLIVINPGPGKYVHVMEGQRLRDDGRCSSRRRVSPETALAIECQ